MLSAIQADFLALRHKHFEIMALKKKLPIQKDVIAQATKRTIMTNTITLSSNMDSLILIDEGKATVHLLSHPNGLIIGTLRGQILAGTSESLPEAAEILKTITISLEAERWTIFYDRPGRTLNVIGATDIDLGLVGDREAPSRAVVHKLAIGGNPVHVRRIGNTITISLLKS